MFGTKSRTQDIKKSTLKIQDSKKDSTSRLRHLKAILEIVDIEEAKSLFETNFSHVYYILYDTFVQAEANLRQKVHKAHREELDGSLWLLGKILCLLPELIGRRWQCHSLGRIMSKLLHHGNSSKLRKEGVRFFLLWYQSLGENAPNNVHLMFNELVPGLTIPLKGSIRLSETEFNTSDLMNHPNMKLGELGTSVFHDTGAHPVKSPEITPLLLPASNERSAVPDPKDGLEILLDCMVQATGCLKWRDNSPQKHMKSFSFLLQRFREVYLPIFCPNFDSLTSIYEPKLDLPGMRTIGKREELMSSCIVVLVNWISKYTRDKITSSRFDQSHIDDEISAIGSSNINEYSSLLTNLKCIGFSQPHLVRDVLYSTRDNVNFIHESYRQAFLLGYTTKSQIIAIRTAIAVYKEWMSTSSAVFLLEPEDNGSVGINKESSTATTTTSRSQRLRTDSYLGAISKENLLIRAGLQNVLQVFVTNAANVFMISTSHLNIAFQSKSRDTTPLDEQTDICKSVLNIYRTLVMNTRMDSKSWEQILLVLLQITSVILSQPPPNSKRNNLGGRLAQPVFQTLIVTWIRAHTNVPVNILLWEKFLNVLSSLTHREELIIEWDKTMQTLTRVMARQVYNLNLQDLPLDRLAEQKSKRKRGVLGGGGISVSGIGGGNAVSGDININAVFNGRSNVNSKGSKRSNHQKEIVKSEDKSDNLDETMMINEESRLRLDNNGCSFPGTPLLSRSYSEGSLSTSLYRKSRSSRKRLKNNSTRIPVLPTNVEYSLNRMLSGTPVNISMSSETLNNLRLSYSSGDQGNGGNTTNGSGTLRRVVSYDSIRPSNKDNEDESESQRDSRSPSPSASGSIKDSPIQIDVIAGDSSSIDTQEDSLGVGNNSISSCSGGILGNGFTVDRRSIIMGGTARGWLPDVAAIMWKRMLGALGDVNKILNPKLHAQVFKHLVDITDNLIKIKSNQGISSDNQSTPIPPTIIPPIGIVAPWCYVALSTLDSQYREGKLWALQLLCIIARYGPPMSNDQLPLFYHALHQSLTCEDRSMAYTVLKYLGGSRFLSLLFPGHSLLLLDLVHASTVILTSFEVNGVPRSEVAGLLGSLLCFPKTSLPKPVLQPSESIVDLMECPDLQDHILNIILRCARREPTSRARCVAIVSLGQWILLNLKNPIFNQKTFQQNVPYRNKSMQSNVEQHSDNYLMLNPRIKESIQVLLQALQFKHRVIARVAAETLKLCAEKAKEIAEIERLPQLIINAICIALEIQNVTHPKDCDKIVLTSLLLTLGEFCMAMPVTLLISTLGNGGSCVEGNSLMLIVLKVLHQIATGSHTDRIKLFTADEDFDMSINVDDIRTQKTSDAVYQTQETTQNCIATIRLCAKTIAMHLVTNIAHFPMGIGASRLSSMVDEQDDMFSVNQHDSVIAPTGSIRTSTAVNTSTIPMSTSILRSGDSVDLNATTYVINSSNVQLFLLNPGLVTSFIELPFLKLPGGGITAGLITADRQVRVLLRDISGKTCWDASILYKEPLIQVTNIDINRHNNLNSGNDKNTGGNNHFQTGTLYERRSFLLGASLDQLNSTIGIPMKIPQHTIRHRSPHQLPIAKELAADLDQLDDLLQYIGYTSRECLDGKCSELNSAAITPLGQQLEAQTISIILNQRSIEQDYVTKHFNPGCDSINFTKSNIHVVSDSEKHQSIGKNYLPFHYCRLLFSQLGLAGWERRKRTNLLIRSEKMLRELRNLDTQKCRETHKIAVIYVANGQEDKNSILRNSCGSATYEMFISALGWEVELETHNGFLGGLPRQGCGSTSPYYATPFLEVIYHVATRMPSDTSESLLNKTRHLGNDEVHIVWSEHYRDYRRDILPTEFCDILIVIYPLKSGLFRITINRKPEVPWFGPLVDETVISGASLTYLVRATAINASRAKRTSLPFYQQFYEERKRSLETVATRHRDSNTFEEFVARIFVPKPNTVINSGNCAPLAAALIDHQRTSNSKIWAQHQPQQQQQLQQQQQIQQQQPQNTIDISHDITQQVLVMTSVALDQPSPRPLRKLHPFKTVPKKLSQQSQPQNQQQFQYHPSQSSSSNTPPDSPTLLGRKFK